MSYTHVVSINNGAKVFAAPHGATLLEVLDSQGIHLPSACAGSGRCGLCRVIVQPEISGAGSREPTLLTSEQPVRGVHLSCQLTVEQSLSITIPPELIAAREYEGRVTGKRVVAPEMLELSIRLISPDSFTFHPGQYVMVRGRPDPDAPPVLRAFSISSSAADTDRIELLVKRNAQGSCTAWMFDTLRQGDSISFIGPRGNAYLRNTMKPILLIAGGSGMAPVRSIVMTLRDQSIERSALFFFGGLTRQDLFYIEQMHQLEKELMDFRFVPALSEEPSESPWQGERGLIPEVIDRRLPHDCSGFEAYLCGRPEMIDACVPILEHKGMRREDMAFDYFRTARPLK